MSDKAFALKANYLAISNHMFKVCFLNRAWGVRQVIFIGQSQVCCIQCETFRSNSPEELHAPGTCTKITYFLVPLRDGILHPPTYKKEILEVILLLGMEEVLQ